MDKAMRVIWRMERKAEQKQLNRLAFGVLRARWAESPWRVIALFALRSAASWLVIWGVMFAGFGWILFCYWLPSFGEFYDALAATGREDFVRQSQQFATLLGDFSRFPTVLLSVFLGAGAVWSSCMKIARLEQRDRGCKTLRENTQFMVVHAPAAVRPENNLKGDKE
jgi:hypothetical protein